MKKRALFIIPLLVAAMVLSSFAASLSVTGKKNVVIPGAGQPAAQEEYTLTVDGAPVAGADAQWEISINGDNYLEWDFENPDDINGFFNYIKGASIKDGVLTVTDQAEESTFYVRATYQGESKSFKVNLVTEAVTEVATVSFTSQFGGAFLHAPAFDAEVSSDLAESYGFEDSVDGVSVLDVLVKAHELTFGDDCTEATAATYLKIGQYGSPDTQFGVSSSEYFGGFLLNHAMANDGTKYDANNYNATTVTTQAVTDGDFVEFFFYEDEFYGDSINWFTDGAGNYSRTFETKAHVGLDLTLNGFFAMSASMFADEAEMVASDDADVTEDAQIYLVDLDTGALTEIEGAVTDEDGVVTLRFNTPGTYTIAAGTGDAMFTQILMLTTVTVEADDFNAVKDGDNVNIVGTVSDTVFAAKYDANERIIGVKKITDESRTVAFGDAAKIKVFSLADGVPFRAAITLTK